MIEMHFIAHNHYKFNFPNEKELLKFISNLSKLDLKDEINIQFSKEPKSYSIGLYNLSSQDIKTINSMLQRNYNVKEGDAEEILTKEEGKILSKFLKKLTEPYKVEGPDYVNRHKITLDVTDTPEHVIIDRIMVNDKVIG